MAQFTTEVFQNEFLPDGGTDVHAIVRVTCRGAGAAGATMGAEAAEIVIVDTSGSMGPNGIAQHAAGGRWTQPAFVDQMALGVAQLDQPAAFVLIRELAPDAGQIAGRLETAAQAEGLAALNHDHVQTRGNRTAPVAGVAVQ